MIADDKKMIMQVFNCQCDLVVEGQGQIYLNFIYMARNLNSFYIIRCRMFIFGTRIAYERVKGNKVFSIADMTLESKVKNI